MDEKKKELTCHFLLITEKNNTRLWPISTPEKPKQFCHFPLPSPENTLSLLQQTVERIRPLENSFSYKFFLAPKKYEKLLKNNIDSEEDILIEPEAKNTAACIVLGLMALLKRGASPEDLVAILPSDHLVTSSQEFTKTLSMALRFSKAEKKIGIIGITPQGPREDFGYIQTSPNSYDVLKFHEKPSREKALEYLEQGHFYWNAGMFLGPISCFIEEIQRHAPSLYACAQELLSLSFPFPLEKLISVYQKMPSLPFDVAILEKSSSLFMTQATFSWDDLGTWPSLEQLLPFTYGANVIEKKSSRNTVANFNDTPLEIQLIGIEDCYLIFQENRCLIAKKDLISFINKSDSDKRP